MYRQTQNQNNVCQVLGTISVCTHAFPLRQGLAMLSVSDREISLLTSTTAINSRQMMAGLFQKTRCYVHLTLVVVVSDERSSDHLALESG